MKMYTVQLFAPGISEVELSTFSCLNFRLKYTIGFYQTVLSFAYEQVSDNGSFYVNRKGSLKISVKSYH